MNSMCFLIMSCDSYHDVWRPCITFLKKYLDSEEIRVYLSTESYMDDSISGFDQVILTGLGEWSFRLKKTLSQISEELVFLLLDDFWLTDRLALDYLSRDIQFLQSNKDIGVIYINYVNWKFLEDYNDDYNLWKKNDIYRINTRPAIWRKEYLLQILDETESIWQFERIGSIRSNDFEYKVLCSKKQYISFIWAVTAGKYERKAFKYAQSNGFLLDTSYRCKQSIFDEIRYWIRSKIFMINPEFITCILGKLRG